MPTNLRIIHASDFLKVTAQGDLAFEESKKALVQVATTAESLTNYVTILDTRKAQVHLSTTDLWYLAAELAELGGVSRHRTAVLCPLQEFSEAQFFALCAQNRGLQVRGLTSFEEAVEWLTETLDSSPEAKADRP